MIGENHLAIRFGDGFGLGVRDEFGLGWGDSWPNGGLSFRRDDVGNGWGYGIAFDGGEVDGGDGYGVGSGFFDGSGEGRGW